MTRVDINQSTDVQEVVFVDEDHKTRRHSWPHAEGDEGYRSIDGHDQPDGNSRTERVCRLCGLVKITMHSPDGRSWRAWRTKAGKQWDGELTPPCLEVVS